MKLLRKQNAVAALLIALPLIALPIMAQTALVRPRIQGTIDNAQRTTLAGSHPMIVNSSSDLGAVDPSMALHGISLVLSRTAQQEAALQALLAAQQNPASPQYHQWLTPDQFAAEFGVADADIAAAEGWLQQQGFSIDSVARSRNRVLFSGTAAMVASAFGASVHSYRAVDGSTHYAPANDLTVPSALSSVVLTVGNLSSFRPRAQLKLNPARANPQFTSSVSGNHYIGPGDLAVMYDVKPVYQAGYSGVNQSIAVIGQSNVALSDVTAFQVAAGTTAKTPVLVPVPGSGTPYYSSGDEAESDLDLEYTSTMAPGAQVYLVFTGDNQNYGAFDALVYAVDERIAPVISSSYAACEPGLGSTNQAKYDLALEQAAAQGQTVISAAGDQGSTGCYGDYTTAAANEQLAVNFPASSVYVTAMGGTEIPTADAAASNSTYWTAANGSDVIASAKSYIPEQAWNDDVAEESGGEPASGGGGVSIYEPRPSWQTGVTVGGVAIPSGNYRLVPDISLVASNYNAPLLFCSSDTSAWSSTQDSSCTSGFRDQYTNALTVAGGTSFDAPIFSGMLALINQALNSTGQGLINPTLYSLASNATTYGTAFHDITVAGNQCLSGTAICGTGVQVTDYAAATGYDEASGLGSVDLYNLLTAWPKPAAASLAETTTTVMAATTTPAAGATDTVTIKVAPVSGTTVPAGTVAVSVDGASAGSLPLTNGSATYSFSSTTYGAHVIVATYSPSGTFGASSGTLGLSVTPAGSFTLSASQSSITVAPGASGSFVISVTPSGGYTGTVTVNQIFYSGSLTNFCVTDTTNGSLTVTGTTVATDTLTFYTNAATCTSLGLTILHKGGATGGQAVLSKVGPGLAAALPTPAFPPLRRAALSVAMACLLLTFGAGRRSRLLKGKLTRAGLSLAFVGLISLAGFGLTACSSNAASSAPSSTNYTGAGTYPFVIVAGDSRDAALGSEVTVTVTVN